MSWTERQQAMLRAMGLRVWQPALAEAPPPGPAAGASLLAAALTETPPEARLAAAVAAPAPTPGPALARRALAQATPGPTAAPPAPAQPVMAALRGDVAALGWPELRQAVAACTACGLCASRQQTVFGHGAPLAHWLVVGEAPGEQEDRQGLPFVGPSGALLDQMLSALQLTRADPATGVPPQRRVFVANTVKCKPPRNRNPRAEELAACEPFLRRQIELLQPRIILALGAFAIKALLRSDEPVGKLRGRVHQYQGVPVVVSYHPAYLLRQPLEKARAWDDLCLAAQVAEAGAEASPLA